VKAETDAVEAELLEAPAGLLAQNGVRTVRIVSIERKACDDRRFDEGGRLVFTGRHGEGFEELRPAFMFRDHAVRDEFEVMAVSRGLEGDGVGSLATGGWFEDLDYGRSALLGNLVARPFCGVSSILR
jgi:hypothetical protein